MTDEAADKPVQKMTLSASSSWIQISLVSFGVIEPKYLSVLSRKGHRFKLEALAGGGKFARVATIRLASYWFEKEDFVKAEELLVNFPDSNKDLFYYQARDLLGQVYRKQDKLDEALAVYERIAENSSGYSLDVVYSHMAEIYDEKGDADKALEFYKKLQEEFAQSYYAYDAAAKIRELEEKK